MVRLTRIYTRGGDEGETSLVGGRRVAKHDLRVEAYGTVDEANAVLGLARLRAKGALAAMLARIQNDLFDLGADLATPPGRQGQGRVAHRRLAGQAAGARDRRPQRQLKPLDSFVLPGGSELAASLHVARTVVRRAERRAVALAKREAINPEAIKYLNRLSDHLFVLARFANAKGKKDLLWKPGANR